MLKRRRSTWQFQRSGVGLCPMVKSFTYWLHRNTLPETTSRYRNYLKGREECCNGALTMSPFKGKKAQVTSTSRDIGAAIVKRLSEEAASGVSAFGEMNSKKHSGSE